VQPYLQQNNISIAHEFASKLGINEGFQAIIPSDIMGSDILFGNIQPLPVKQTGYIGPSITGGLFDAEAGVLSALKAGVRFFTLQVDYMDVKKPGFDVLPYTPTLVYRTNDGTLTSTNSAPITEVASQLAKAFSPEMNNNKKPLIVYLHFVRVPYTRYDHPDKYVKYLSSVAQMLEPLAAHTIGTNPDNYTRQAKEKGLLKLPINSLSGKMILMTNADTSLFRNLDAIGMSPIEPKFDLDYLTNMRVYKDEAADDLGLTDSPPPNKLPAAVVVPFRRIQAMSPSERDIFATHGKTRFVIAMPDQGGNPSAAEIATALTKAAVNVVPLNLFGEGMAELKSKLALWKTDDYFMTKPLQYRANPNEKPYVPDTALNAMMSG
jgi:hypothetical protein